MKKNTVLVIVLFFLTSIYNMYGQSTNLTTLVNERRNVFQELQYNVKTKAQTINHKNFDNFFNDVTRLDDKISDEVHKVDSTFENNARILPVLNSTIVSLRTKKDNAMMFFYIFLIIVTILTILYIYIAVKFRQYQNKMIFLKADIKDANNNYSRVSDEKLSLQKEMRSTVKSFDLTLENINNEIEIITTENQKLKNELLYLRNNEDNPDIIVENRLLKEAIVELENIKNNLEGEIGSTKKDEKAHGNLKKEYEQAIKEINNEHETELENLKKKHESEIEDLKKELQKVIETSKKDKRIIIGSPDDTTEIVKKELAKRIDYLENALKAKEIMEGIIVKKNSELEIKMKEISENYNLLLTEFDEEKTYNSNLNSKLQFLEEELSEKDHELKNLWSKVSNTVDIPKNTTKSNDPETNLLRTLEKLSRLRQAEILNESEYSALKEKIINQM